ncbi:MAG: TRAP transporter permease [Acetivibrionales bacterium]|jgi:TRAP transporter 4TM/12TM fusion protein
MEEKVLSKEQLEELIYAEEASGGSVAEGKRTPLQTFTRIMTIIFTLYMFYATVFGPYKTTIVHRAIFLLVMVFIFYSSGKPLKFGKNNRFPLLAKTIDWILIGMAVFSLGYTIMNFEHLLGLLSANQLTTMDLIVGAMIIIVVLETARRTSFVFFILASIGILYTLFGNRLSGAFNHAGMSYKRLIFLTSFTEEGVFGLGLAVASTYLFMFIMFGACMNRTRASDYLMDVCNGMVGKYDGGPAKTEVVSSALMGMVSGSSIANVVTTGSITIPMMKKLGFKPHVAASIEITSSEGGQIMPPVMGAAAFLMAEMTGIPYSSIAIAAIIPAILYFTNAFLVVHFESKKSGIKGLKHSELPSVKAALAKGWHVLSPVIVLFYLLLGAKYTTMFSGMACIILTIISAMSRKHTRMSLREILDIFEQGCRDVAGVVAILAGLGLVTQAIIVTGLGARFTEILIGVAGGSPIVLVILAVLITLLLGCGMTTPVAYSLVAIFVAPSLVKVGFPVLGTHMFLFFFAIKSGSTPPVAVVAAVGASIANASFWKTAFTGTFFGTASYLMAFAYLYNPALLMNGSWGWIAFSFIAALFGCIAAASAIQGWLFTRFAIYERLIMGVAAILLAIPNPATFIPGMIIVSAEIFMSYKKRQAEKNTLNKAIA